MCGDTPSQMLVRSLRRALSPRRALSAEAAEAPSPYPHMLAPLALRSGHVLRNRVIMGSMHSVRIVNRHRVITPIKAQHFPRARGVRLRLT